MPPKYGWVYDPHSGGVKISEAVKRETVARLEKYAATHFAGLYTRLGIRFRGALCYIDAFTEPDEPDETLLKLRKQTREEYFESMRTFPLHLCRIRHFTKDRWSMAFYKYSDMKYEPCYFANGTMEGTPEEALEIAGNVYLRDR